MVSSPLAVSAAEEAGLEPARYKNRPYPSAPWAVTWAGSPSHPLAGHQTASIAALATPAAFAWPASLTQLSLPLHPLACKTASKYLVTLPQCFLTVSQRLCSRIPQTLRCFLGFLTSICSHGLQRKAVLSAPHSKMARSSVSPLGSDSHCVLQEQVVSPTPLTNPGVPKTPAQSRSC